MANSTTEKSLFHKFCSCEKSNNHLRKSIEQAFRFVLPRQRCIKKMSQYEFSKKCGFSRQYISLIESGKRMPKLEFVFNFADGFDMKIQDFMHLLVEKVVYYEELDNKK
ncbi:MAG: helix-turn-helix transcriptional regulator [Fibromonadales bacterium]|nr:helix-turn-helix transcriptional regulator [Fibromonadales bacterium]